MDDKDLTIQRMRQELGKWKNRTLEAAYECCDRCKSIFNAQLPSEETPCDDCRIMKIRKEAVK